MARREFGKPVLRAAYKRSGGICECHLVPSLPTFRIGCGQLLGPANTFFEHVDPDGAGGAPTLENCAVLTKTCWRLKTDSYDRPLVAKTIRQHDRDIGIPRSAGGRRLRSRNTFRQSAQPERRIR